MKYTAAIATAAFCLFHHATVTSSSGHECGDKGVSANAVSLSLSSKRNRIGGDWVTDFSLTKDDDSNADALNNITFDLSQEVIERGGKKALRIRGVLSGITTHHSGNQKESSRDKLRFHNTCGSNVAVLSDGQTILKINLDKDGFSMAFTHRPLKSNEILEVIMPRKHDKFAHSLGIGLTTLSPNAASSFQHINNIHNTSWALYDGVVFRNGQKEVQNYGKSFDTLAVGDRVGVMRSNTGSVHFFWNGVDQGPAASNVPYPVYGVIELRGHFVMATIVDE